MDLTVVKAMKILELLADERSPSSITVLSRRLGFTKSNVFRLLGTLVELGYVNRIASTGQYEMTLKVWRLGEKIRSRLDVHGVSSEYLNKLMQETTETVHLSIFNDDDVTIVNKIESLHPVRAYTSIGGRVPPHATATAKVLLAHQPQEVIDKYISSGLEKFTKNTITNPKLLMKELEKIRARGFGINQQEWRDDVCGIASPIRNSDGVVVAAVGISGPAHRLVDKDFDELATKVIRCANAISAELGYGDPESVSQEEPVPVSSNVATRPKRQPRMAGRTAV